MITCHFVITLYKNELIPTVDVTYNMLAHSFPIFAFDKINIL